MKNRTLVGALAALALSGIGNGQETGTGGMAVRGLLGPNGSQTLVDLTVAAAALPAKSGILAARPGACTAVQMYLATVTARIWGNVAQ
jgi:hypothetical protein